MKVAVLNYEFPPQGGGGGVVMRDLVLKMAHREDVQLTLIFAWDPRLGPVPYIEGCVMRPVMVRRRSIHSTGSRAVAQFLWGARHYLREPFDLLHFHFSIPTGLLRWVAPDTPYICSMHGIDAPGFILEEAAMQQRLLAPLNRRILRDAQFLIVPGKTLQQAVHAAVPQANVEVIPHGVNVKEFPERTIWPEVARRFITVARLTRLKRVHHVVEAVVRLHQKHDDVSLDIFGDGDQRAELEELIRSKSASSYIRLHGYAKKEVLLESLGQFDAFVMTSVTEAFGLVYVEAMAAGLPVVAANNAGPKEIITQDANGLLIERDSVDALVAAMTRLANEPGLAARLGRAGREKVLSAFDWPKVAARYMQIYRAAVHRGN
jgi:glycosyltransferase involved in cell wall biosynthesis